MLRRLKSGRISPMEVIPGINEVEIYILLISIVTGMVYLFGAPPPGTLVARFPGWSTDLWNINLVAGSALVLVSGLWPRSPNDISLIRGLRFYLAGWLYVGVAGSCYALSILLTLRLEALLAGSLILGWSLSGYRRSWRAWKIIREAEKKEPKRAPDGNSSG